MFAECVRIPLWTPTDMNGLKNFFITFLIAALIFGLLAYFIVDFASDSLFGTSGETQPSDVSPVQVDPGSSAAIETDAEGNLIFYEIKSGSFNMLFIGTDYQPEYLHDYDLSVLNAREKADGFPYRERLKSADALVLMRVDTDRKEVVICSIPGNTRVLSGGVSQTLGELYDSKGADYVISKVTALTSLGIDYYAVMNPAAFAAVIDSIGGVTYDVPCAMHYEDAAQGLLINLQPGLTQLSGDKALQLLRFNLYEDGVHTRADTVASFGRALLDKLTGGEYLSKALSFYQQWTGYVVTNMTENDLTEHLDAFLAYPSFTVTAQTYPGSYRIENGTVYYDPDTDAAADYFAQYKN